jgi:hypothetical protein
MKSQSRIFAALTLALAVAACVSSSAQAQVIRRDAVDRMTDKRRPVLIVPSNDFGRSSLSIRCDGMTVSPIFGASIPAEIPTTYLSRIDQQPPVSGNGLTLPGQVLSLERGNAHLLREALRDGHTLALQTASGQEFEFSYGEDNKEAFSLMAELHGADRNNARGSFIILEEKLDRAVAGQNAELVALLKRLGIPLRDGQRIRTTGELIPSIVRALRANREKQGVEEMGNVFFGFGWPGLRVWLMTSDDYLLEDGPMPTQLDWLEGRCTEG